MERVLIVDDDADIQRLVSYNLSQAGFRVSTAATGLAAIELVQKHPPDLIILDIMLPDLDGLEVCRTLRHRDDSRRIPIIMLTARTEEVDRVVGFELGADDYVMKPFSPRELVLRVKSIFRRMKDERSDMLRLGNIQIYPDRRQCFVQTNAVVLTVKEFDLLHFFIMHPRQVLSRELIYDRIWGYDFGVESARKTPQRVIALPYLPINHGQNAAGKKEGKTGRTV